MMLALFLAQHTVELMEVETIWFSSYVFLSLFIFSTFSLWYCRQR